MEGAAISGVWGVTEQAGGAAGASQNTPADPSPSALRPAPSPLPSYLRPGLDLVLCGCNPGLFSAAIGHYFARPGNAFWPLLAEAGITPRLFRPEEDAALLDLGVGLTDVVARPSGGPAVRRWPNGCAASGPPPSVSSAIPPSAPAPAARVSAGAGSRRT